MKLATFMAAAGAFCPFTGAGIALGDAAYDGGSGYCEKQATTNHCPAKTCYASIITYPDGTGNSDFGVDTQFSVF